ncbi:MAG: four helix bundle protein [Bacteroidales bacterium]|nr:four helix bundle protein [Bacteroidales bacterium]
MDKELINKNRNINRGFRKLVVWMEAIDLYVYVVDELRNLSEMPYKVKAQIEDSALSVSSNIAEGYSRRSLKETIRFNNYALSSLAENYTQILAQLNVERVRQEWFDIYDAMHYSIENKLVVLSKKQVELLNEKSNWNDDYILREDETGYEPSHDSPQA